MSMRIVTILFFLFLSTLNAQQWESKIVKRGSDGKLVYTKDAEGNRIPDFSYAGYKNGAAAIPQVPVVLTIDPVPGDNTKHLQDAIAQVAAGTPDASGMHGTLLLRPGVYRIVNNTLLLNTSGIVLRGSGDGSDSTKNTILLGIGDGITQETVMIAGGGSSKKWIEQISRTKTDITSDTVYVGERSFTVQDASKYAIGDNVILYHPCTSAWLQAVNYGATATDAQWTVNEQPIVYNRYVTAIAGNLVTVDAPFFATFIRSRSQAYMYKYARTGLLTNIGIENLRIDIRVADTPANANGEENHALQTLELVQIEDAWVKNCTFRHFIHAGIMTSTATRITIDSCRSIEPVSIITGERRYNFDMSTASQLVLIKNCYTSYGRHDYVSNGTSWTSGCVFVDGVSDSTYNSSEGHRRWSQGLLFDNITYRTPQTSYVIGLYNRGDYGTGHGWASANSVVWNCNSGGKSIIIQKPPTAQNYAIGCTGNVSGATPPAPFAQPAGYIEGSNSPGISPRSLYYAQLNERLAPAAVTPKKGINLDRSQLFQNYPNPFNPSTAIRFDISNRSHVRLEVFDILGRRVAVLIDAWIEPGEYRENFDATAASCAGGVYLAVLQTGELRQVHKLVLTK